MSSYYIERDGVPVRATLEEFSELYKEDGEVRQRRVALDVFSNGYTVSTVFLGIDHNHFGIGPPILYETMVWREDGVWEDYQERYSSRADALRGHAQAVATYIGKDPP